VELSDKVAQALSDIAEKGRRVDQLVAEVAAASREQSQGITQISVAVTQMDKVTQGSSANAEEAAAPGHELESQAPGVE
jgi:methyl-accepting chemotaxis protein